MVANGNGYAPLRRALHQGDKCSEGEAERHVALHGKGEAKRSVARRGTDCDSRESK